MKDYSETSAFHQLEGNKDTWFCPYCDNQLKNAEENEHVQCKSCGKTVWCDERIDEVLNAAN